MDAPHITTRQSRLLQILRRAREEFFAERDPEQLPVTAEMAAESAVYWLVKTPPDVSVVFQELILLCSRVYATDDLWESLRLQSRQRLSYTQLIQQLAVALIRDNLLAIEDIRLEDTSRQARSQAAIA